MALSNNEEQKFKRDLNKEKETSRRSNVGQTGPLPKPLTEKGYQPGEAQTSPAGPGITRRQLTSAGSEEFKKLASAPGSLARLRQAARMQQTAKREQKEDNQKMSPWQLRNEYKRLKKAAKANKEAKGGLGQAIASTAGKTASAELLKQAWLNIIDSFGLTLFYINLHFVMYYLGGPLSEFFCTPGSEWFTAAKGPAMGGGMPTGGGKTAAAKAPPEPKTKSEKRERGAKQSAEEPTAGGGEEGSDNPASKTLSLGFKALEIVEVTVVLAINFIILIIICGIIAIFYLVATCEGQETLVESGITGGIIELLLRASSFFGLCADVGG